MGRRVGERHLVRTEGAFNLHTIDDDAGNDQIGVVEHGSGRMAQRIAHNSPPS